MISSKKYLTIIFSGLFIINSLILDLLSLNIAVAADLELPVPNELCEISAHYSMPELVGLAVGDSAFDLSLLFDSNDEDTVDEKIVQEAMSYFLAALSMPAEKMWVNLSPYEGNRIIDELLGQTELGKAFLDQDYLLKLFSASLTNPETKLGQDYWVNNSQSDNLSKVWISPKSAAVYEHENKVLITKSELAAEAKAENKKSKVDESLLEVIENELNFGKNFAKMRQIYNAIILARWFKKKVKNSILSSYANSSVIRGIENQSLEYKEKIWQQYCQSFEQGVYNKIIKETTNNQKQKRQYIAGGVIMPQFNISQSAMENFDQGGELFSSAIAVFASKQSSSLLSDQDKKEHFNYDLRNISGNYSYEEKELYLSSNGSLELELGRNFSKWYKDIQIIDDRETAEKLHAYLIEKSENDYPELEIQVNVLVDENNSPVKLVLSLLEQEKINSELSVNLRPVELLIVMNSEGKFDLIKEDDLERYQELENQTLKPYLDQADKLNVGVEALLFLDDIDEYSYDDEFMDISYHRHLGNYLVAEAFELSDKEVSKQKIVSLKKTVTNRTGKVFDWWGGTEHFPLGLSMDAKNILAKLPSKVVENSLVVDYYYSAEQGIVFKANLINAKDLLARGILNESDLKSLDKEHVLQGWIHDGQYYNFLDEYNKYKMLNYLKFKNFSSKHFVKKDKANNSQVQFSFNTYVDSDMAIDTSLISSDGYFNMEYDLFERTDEIKEWLRSSDADSVQIKVEEDEGVAKFSFGKVNPDSANGELEWLRGYFYLDAFKDGYEEHFKLIPEKDYRLQKSNIDARNKFKDYVRGRINSDEESQLSFTTAFKSSGYSIYIGDLEWEPFGKKARKVIKKLNYDSKVSVTLHDDGQGQARVDVVMLTDEELSNDEKNLLNKTYYLDDIVGSEGYREFLSEEEYTTKKKNRQYVAKTTKDYPMESIWYMQKNRQADFYGWIDLFSVVVKESVKLNNEPGKIEKITGKIDEDGTFKTEYNFIQFENKPLGDTESLSKILRRLDDEQRNLNIEFYYDGKDSVWVHARLRNIEELLTDGMLDYNELDLVDKKYKIAGWAVDDSFIKTSDAINKKKFSYDYLNKENIDSKRQNFSFVGELTQAGALEWTSQGKNKRWVPFSSPETRSIIKSMDAHSRKVRVDFEDDGNGNIKISTELLEVGGLDEDELKRFKKDFELGEWDEKKQQHKIKVFRNKKPEVEIKTPESVKEEFEKAGVLELVDELSYYPDELSMFLSILTDFSDEDIARNLSIYTELSLHEAQTNNEKRNNKKKRKPKLETVLKTIDVFDSRVAKISDKQSDELMNVAFKIGLRTMSQYDYSGDVLKLFKKLKTKRIKIKKFFSELESKIAVALKEIDAISPSHITVPLLPHQKYGVYMAAKYPEFANFNEARTGKTLESLASLDPNKNNLIVVPARLIDTWKEEIAAHTTFENVNVINGELSQSKKKRLLSKIADIKGGKITIVSVEDYLRNPNYDTSIIEKDLDTVIFDEAQFFSNYFGEDSGDNSIQAENAQKVKAKKKLILSATPFHSKPKQLYALYSMLFPEEPMTNAEFNKRYCNGSTKSLVDLYMKLSQKSTRIIKKDVFRVFDESMTEEEKKRSIPKLNTENIKAEMTIEQSQEMLRLLMDKEIADKEDALSNWEIKQRAENIWWAVQETENGFVADERSPAWKALDAHVEEKLNNGKGIVYAYNLAQMEAMRARLEAKYGQGAVAMMNGDTDSTKELNWFKENDDCKILIMSVQSGVGIDVSQASWMVYAQLPKYFSQFYQSKERPIGVNPFWVRPNVDLAFLVPEYNALFIEQYKDDEIAKLYLEAGTMYEIDLLWLQMQELLFMKTIGGVQVEPKIHRLVKNTAKFKKAQIEKKASSAIDGGVDMVEVDIVGVGSSSAIDSAFANINSQDLAAFSFEIKSIKVEESLEAWLNY